jgi:hypothetical protein
VGFRPVYELYWEVVVHSAGWEVVQEPGGDIEPGAAGLASRRYPLSFRRAVADAGDLDASLRLSTGFWQGEERRRFEKQIRLSSVSGAGSLSLHVVDPEGEPVRGASVNLDGDRDYAARSSLRGQAVIQAMLPGTYALSVSAQGYRLFEGRQRIEPNRAAERQITLQFLADAALELKVLDKSDGHAITGALVALKGPLGLSAHSDAGGWARLNVLRPARYGIQVSAQGYRPASGQRDIGAGERLRKKVTLRPLTGGTPLPAPKPDPQERADAPPKPGPAVADNCWEDHRQKVENALAANSDGDGSLVLLLASPACKAAHKRCYDAAYDEGAECRNKAKTTAESKACNDGVSRGWGRCAYQEVQCSAAALKQKCGIPQQEGGKPPRNGPGRSPCCRSWRLAIGEEVCAAPAAGANSRAARG